jgi:integrase
MKPLTGIQQVQATSRVVAHAGRHADLLTRSQQPEAAREVAREPRSVVLTVRLIAALPITSKRYTKWDAKVPGFGVRVGAGGAKTYILKYRLVSGRVRWKTIARVEKLALYEARKRAKRDAGNVADDKDPLAQRDASRGAVTTADACDRFLREHVDVKLKPKSQRLYHLAIDDHIKRRLGTIPIAEITTEDAVRLHNRLRATPILANRCLAVLSSLLKWSAHVAKLRPAGPNPCSGIKHWPERKRKRYLNADEYARVGRALRTVKSPISRTAIELLILTGARPAEIASLRHEYVNLPRRVAELPDSKTGAKPIYLSPAAVRLLKKWPRWATSEFVFPGNKRGVTHGHIDPATLTHEWARVRKHAGVDDVRLYDACRHSYASTAISHHGLTLAQVGGQLGHSQPATTARYAHLIDSVARQQAATVGAGIAAALKRRVRRSPS